MKKNNGNKLMRNETITANEYEFIYSANGDWYFVKLNEANNWLDRDVRNLKEKFKKGQLRDKNYVRGLTSDGREIIYPVAEVEKPENRVNVTVKQAYLAYYVCEKAKEAGNPVNFATALSKISSEENVEATIERIAKEDLTVDADTKKDLDSAAALTVWEPNFVLVNNLINEIDKSKKGRINVRDIMGRTPRLLEARPDKYKFKINTNNENIGSRMNFAANATNAAVNEASENQVEATTENKKGNNGGTVPPTTGGTSVKVSSRKPIGKKIVGVGLALLIGATLATAITGSIYASKESAKNQDNPPKQETNITEETSITEKEIDEKIENLMEGRFLSYETHGDQLIVCEWNQKKGTIDFGQLLLNKKYASIDKLSQEEKNDLYAEVESKIKEIKVFSSLPTNSEESIVLTTKNGNTEETRNVPQIVKGSNPFNTKADDNSVTIFEKPNKYFDRKSSTGYKTTMTVYTFYPFGEGMKTTVKNIVSDCAQDATLNEQYAILASENENAEEKIIMNSYSPIGYLKAKGMEITTETEHEQITTPISEKFAAVERKLRDEKIISESQNVIEEVGFVNGSEYFMVSDTATESSRLYSISLNEETDAIEYKVYEKMSALNINSVNQGIIFDKLTSGESVGEDKEVFVELNAATQKDEQTVDFKLNLLALTRNQENEVEAINTIDNAVVISSSNENSYSKTELINILARYYKDGRKNVKDGDVVKFNTRITINEIVNDIPDIPQENEESITKE